MILKYWTVTDKTPSMPVQMIMVLIVSTVLMLTSEAVAWGFKHHSSQSHGEPTTANHFSFYSLNVMDILFIISTPANALLIYH